jgi:protein tyrosine/serine phosphatase
MGNIIPKPYGVTASPENRPCKDWARPIALAGVPNLHQVSLQLYRSAQPTIAGLKNLKSMGLNTIINLRTLHSDRRKLRATSLSYERIFMTVWHPKEREIVRFLKIVVNPRRTPVLVHCRDGSDRTGVVCAIYRIAVQGWTKGAALREMTEGKFGYHHLWVNLPFLVNHLDIARIRALAQLPQLGKLPSD